MLVVSSQSGYQRETGEVNKNSTRVDSPKVLIFPKNGYTGLP